MVGEPANQAPRAASKGARLPYWSVIIGLVTIVEVVLVAQLPGALSEYRLWRAQPCFGSNEECTPVGAAIALLWWGILALAWPIAAMMVAAIVRGVWALVYEMVREGRPPDSGA